jgi:hypothetical protein
MIALKLRGKITPEGKLEVTLPAGIPPEEVVVMVESVIDDSLPWEERPWTEEELAELMKPAEPKTGAEIVARILAEGGGWEDKGIIDSEAFGEGIQG